MASDSIIGIISKSGFNDVEVTSKKLVYKIDKDSRMFLPVSYGDNIQCSLIKISPDKYVFNGKPYVTVSNDSSVVKNFIYYSLSSLGVARQTVNLLYQDIYNEKGSVVSVINDFCRDYVTDQKFYLFNTEQTKLLVKEWINKRLMRSLYLLNLTKADIESCKH
jgi:hypothetical protein